MDENNSSEAFEYVRPKMVGHLLIRDAETGEIFVNQRDTMAQQTLIAETNDVDGD